MMTLIGWKEFNTKTLLVTNYIYNSGNFFNRKSKTAAIEANKDIALSPKMNRKVSAVYALYAQPMTCCLILLEKKQFSHKV